MTQEFIVINVHGEIVSLEQFRGRKLVMKHDLDLLDKSCERQLFNALMKHNQDIPLVISWKDLRFLRKIGVRV